LVAYVIVAVAMPLESVESYPLQIG
jgi:hypothetical protein